MQTMNRWLKRIESAADVECAKVLARSDEEVDNVLYSETSVDQHENYGNDAYVMATITRTTMKDLIAEEAERICAERIQEIGQTQLKGTLVDMFQLDENTASNKIKAKSARFLKTIVIESFICGAVIDAMLECL